MSAYQGAAPPRETAVSRSGSSPKRSAAHASIGTQYRTSNPSSERNGPTTTGRPDLAMAVSSRLPRPGPSGGWMSSASSGIPGMKLACLAVRTLFFMRHAGALRNFQTTVEQLVERGHSVHLVFDGQKRAEKAPGNARLLEQAERLPGVTHARAPKQTHPGLLKYDTGIRLGLDYLRYLEPEYSDAPKLRERAEELAPPQLRRGPLARMARSAGGRRLLRRAFGTALGRIPAEPAIVELVREQTPDVVLITPLVEFASPQVRYLRAAQALGIPTALPVHSWDNLTNKGMIHGEPDLVTVW